MSDPIEKDACGGGCGAPAPVLDSGPVPPPVPPAITSGPDYKFGLILERLDDIAESLEGGGLVRLAAEVDALSNSLEILVKGGR